MYDSVRTDIQRYIVLSEAELDFFCSKLILKQLKRREYVFREGQVCTSVVFIRKGCLRYFYLTDGEEQTGQFFFENAWYTDYESFLSEKPTQQFIQALEPTEVFLLPKTALYQLYENNPKFERFGRVMAENAYLGSRKNNVSYLTLSPEERYLKLVEERPKLIERVSLKYIASYLGIQPESLSRIRKRIFEQR
ncbi:Crp/Fnr family transcriptional regulator [Runella slithyformis]|uniref:Transcriptional regulator, Crp/Fnr family n=1 Tax=Runella slithyformis (strain ATCC 29530 / DSM 19594 / LMG 11500 / NCIMB 11436 / LSU 4) TaxID=761193 RepID=A0A7U3ZQT0_RUNSL|nr:Crp/Fnr family transcriptional regulator [Runella slithyformis]AEI51662.1 putative transcriptional regulator, Crp/Fnr family [Runella slithyformis DSM 19594]